MMWPIADNLNIILHVTLKSGNVATDGDVRNE